MSGKLFLNLIFKVSLFAITCFFCSGCGVIWISITEGAGVYGGQYLYVTNFGGSTVSGFLFSPTSGTLTEVSGSPFSTAANPSGMLFINNFLYVACDSLGNNIYTFVPQASTGNLALSDTPLALTGAQSRLQISPQGYLYSSAYTANDVIFLSGAQSGNLSVTQTSVASPPYIPQDMIIDQTGSYLYVDNNSGVNNQISFFTIGGTGTLTYQNSYATSRTFPSQFVLDPTGQFIYVVSAGGGSGSLDSFQIQGGGTLGVINSIVGAPNGLPSTSSTLALHPNGEFLYVANNTDDLIYLFLVNSSTGTLPASGASQASTGGTGPHFLLIDPTGTYLFAGSSTSDTISIFTINQSTGALTQTGSTFTSPTLNGFRYMKLITL